MHTYNINSQYCAPLFRFGWPGPVGLARDTTKKIIITTKSVLILIYTSKLLIEVTRCKHDSINLLKSTRIGCHILREIYRKFDRVSSVKRTSPYKSRADPARKTHFYKQNFQLLGLTNCTICPTEPHKQTINKNNK